MKASAPSSAHVLADGEWMRERGHNGMKFVRLFQRASNIFFFFFNVCIQSSATAHGSWRVRPQLNGMLLPGDGARFSEDVRCAESLLFEVYRVRPVNGQNSLNSYCPRFSFFFLAESVSLSSVCEIARSRNVQDNSGG